MVPSLTTHLDSSVGLASGMGLLVYLVRVVVSAVSECSLLVRALLVPRPVLYALRDEVSRERIGDG
jgi:hypothetical protein